MTYLYTRLHYPARLRARVTINFSGYFCYFNYHGRRDMHSSPCSCRGEYVMSAAETKGRFAEAPSFSLIASWACHTFI